MPIYEFKCPKCQRVFEEMVHFSEMHSEEPCPECGTPSPKLISQTSFLLKGGGWYVSDYGYRKGVSEDGSGTASGSDGKSTSGNSGSSDSGTAGKSETAKPESKPSTTSTPAAAKSDSAGAGNKGTGAA